MPEQSRLARCKPLLGTLVEMACAKPRQDTSASLFNPAFAAVARIHALMSVQLGESDLNRLNRAPPGKWLELDIDTAFVLSQALHFARVSGNAFNPCFASGYDASSAYEVDGRRARRHLACTIDLSGIAKGYAVDRAVALLQGAGMSEILVNAGGDLRHAGMVAQRIALRHPGEPTSYQGSVMLCNQALASSATRGLDGNGLMETAGVRCGHSGERISALRGASVIAPTAMLADVMTKIVLLAPERAEAILHHYHAVPVRVGALTG